MPEWNWHGRKRYGATHKVNNVSLMLYLYHSEFVLDEIQAGSSLSIRISNRLTLMLIVHCESPGDTGYEG